MALTFAIEATELMEVSPGAFLTSPHPFLGVGAKSLDGSV